MPRMAPTAAPGRAALLLACLSASAGAARFGLRESCGAVGDGRSDDGPAIRRCFEKCAAAGGGLVVFEAPGQYLTGPWQLACNNSVVVVEQGAVVRAVPAGPDWPVDGLPSPEPSQGLTSRQADPFIMASHVHNLTLSGGGTVDGLGGSWWREACGNWWCPPGFKSSAPKAWRPFLIRLEAVSRVRIEHLTLQDPGFWCIVPVRSADITIENVTVLAPADSPNTDGVEPMWSERVHCTGCRISNGDDCVTVKSGSRDILVENLECHNSHGITIGSVWYDNVSNVTYRNCSLHRTSHGARIKGRRQGNATVSQIRFEDIRLDRVGMAVEVNMDYETPGSTHPSIGVVATDVSFDGFQGTADQPGSMHCLEGRPCTGFEMSGIKLDVEQSGADWSCEHLKLSTNSPISPSLPSNCS